MRIRFFRAWASNNSGAYLLLGRFAEVTTAEEVARSLNETLAEHDAWVNRDPRPEGPSPFMAFAEKHGLPMQMAWVTWEDGMRCEVLGSQVLMEGYANDMPSTFVAWVAKHGGHVEAEIVHAHGATVLQVEMHTVGGWKKENREASRAALARFVDRVRADPEVQATLVPKRRGDPPREVHAVPSEAPHRLLLAPTRVTQASKAIRDAAREEGVVVRFSVSEWIHDIGDPAAVMAAPVDDAWFDVVVEDPGPTPELLIAAMTEKLGMRAGVPEYYLSNRPVRRTGLPRPWPRAFGQPGSRAHCEEMLAVLLAHGATAAIRPTPQAD